MASTSYFCNWGLGSLVLNSVRHHVSILSKQDIMSDELCGHWANNLPSFSHISRPKDTIFSFDIHCNYCPNDLSPIISLLVFLVSVIGVDGV